MNNSCLLTKGWRNWPALAAAGWMLAWSAPAQTYSVLYTFSGVPGNPDGGDPSSLTPRPGGGFYGTCVNAGLNGWGDIFQIDNTGTLIPIYSFTNRSPATDGSNPFAGLEVGTNGWLYGMAQAGGVYGNGTIFAVITNGAFTNLYSFSELSADTSVNPVVVTNSDGAMPRCALTLNTNNGNFYGTLGQGGTNGFGTLFEVTHSGKVTVLYSFSNEVDGASPDGSLLVYSDGNLYGATYSGGSNGYGTVFQMTAAGRVTPLYSFTNGVDGADPQGALIDGQDGQLYGTCAAGGTNGTGTLFKITTDGVLTPLYSFGPSTNSFTGEYNADGVSPNLLVLASDGNIYGATQKGSPGGDGNIFELTRGGSFSVVYAFTYDQDGGANGDGANPSSLLQSADGNLYGTTLRGGSNGFGTFFTIGLPPSITAQPTNQAIGLGDTAIFSLTASGAQSYQWQQNNLELTNGTQATLIITNAQIGDAGSYQAIVTNPNGAVATVPVTLSITNVPVSFLNTPGELLFEGNQFTMQLTDLTGQGDVVIEASTNLLQWTPIYTNPSGFGTAYFIDSSVGNYPARFYRATTP